ncbi:ABC transporter permease [Natronospora cellulosivora (SeqCode)]
MLILKLGLRNLTRHKKRAIMTAIVISFAVFFYLIVDSLMFGLEDLSYNSIINLESGHFQIAHPEYWEDRDRLPMENLMELSPEIEEKIRNLDGFMAMTEMTRFSARLNAWGDELPITAIAVDPAEYQQVFTTDNYIIEGSMFEADAHQTVLGQSLAELMEVEIGDYIILLTRTVGGTFNTIDLEISGILNTPNPAINSDMVFLPLGVAQNALNMDNQITQTAVKLDINRDRVSTLVEELNQELAVAGVVERAYSWEDLASHVIAFTQAEQVESIAVLTIILLIAAVGIVNTTILAALERMKEIGMMKALGLKESEIVRTFMVEAAGVGIIGGLIGWLMGAAGVFYLTNFGISFGDFLGDDVSLGLPIIDNIYGNWNLSAFVFVFIFGVLVAVLASILPARWAARKDPVKAIHHR